MIRPTSVLATITGRDRPGVTAAFFAALAAHDVDVRDVEQVVIRDRLILTVLFDLHGDTGALRNSVAATAGALGMECEVAIADTDDAKSPGPDGSRHHVMILGRSLRPGALGHIAQRIADTGSNIETVTQMSDPPGLALEMLVRTPDPAGLRAVLVEAAADSGVDLAVEAGARRRCAKRLVLLDLEAISVRTEPVELLAGRPGGAAADRAGFRPVPDGMREFVRALHGAGYRVGIVSDGSTDCTDAIAADLGLDFAATSQAGVRENRVTGRVLDGAGKAAALREFADSVGVPLTQTVAVGSGADDIDMLGAAGLGIAFNAKSALRAGQGSADYLASVLFVLGIGVAGDNDGGSAG